MSIINGYLKMFLFLHNEFSVKSGTNLVYETGDLEIFSVSNEFKRN